MASAFAGSRRLGGRSLQCRERLISNTENTRSRQKFAAMGDYCRVTTAPPSKVVGALVSSAHIVVCRSRAKSECPVFVDANNIVVCRTVGNGVSAQPSTASRDIESDTDLSVHDFAGAINDADCRFRSRRQSVSWVGSRSGRYAKRPESAPGWGGGATESASHRSKRTRVETVPHDLLESMRKSVLRGVGGLLLDTQQPWLFRRKRRCPIKVMAVNH